MSVELNIHVNALDKKEVEETITILQKLIGADAVEHTGPIEIETKVIETKPASLEEEVANMPESELVAEEKVVEPAGVELDKELLPWDHRIHTEAKTKKKDGTWKLKRGIEPAIVESVKGELRLTMQAKPLDIPVTTPAAATTELPSLGDLFANSPLNNAATENTVNEETPDPVLPITFPALLNKITERYSTEFGDAYKTVVDATLQEMGVASVGLLGARPEILPQVDAQLDTLWNGLNG